MVTLDGCWPGGVCSSSVIAKAKQQATFHAGLTLTVNYKSVGDAVTLTSLELCPHVSLLLLVLGPSN